MYSNGCFSWAVLVLLSPPLSITVQAWKCLYYICLVLSALKGWSRFNFLPIIGPFPLLFLSCWLSVSSFDMSGWISGLLLLGLGILWKSFAVVCDVHWYLWKYLQTTETTRNFCVNLSFQFRIWNCIFFSWKDPQVWFSLRYLKHVISYTGSNET